MPKRARDGKSKASKAKKRAIDRYGAAAVAKYYARPMRSLVRAPGETGYVDLASADYNMDTTNGSIVLLATVAQGASVNQRVGKKIMWKSIQCRGNLHNDSTATFNEVAYLIVYDNRPTGALPAITDILVSINSRSFNNDANSGRFKILKRYDTVLQGIPSTSNGAGPVENADFFLKINRKCEFAAAGTGAIGDISLGALYLVTIGSNAGGVGTTDAIMTAAFRTRFVDL